MIDTLLVYYIRTDTTDKNCKLHKFRNTNSNFERFDYFRHASSHNVQVYQFLAKTTLINQSNPCTQLYLQKITSCTNLQLPIVNFEKINYFRHASSYNVHVDQVSTKSG